VVRVRQETVRNVQHLTKGFPGILARRLRRSLINDGVEWQNGMEKVFGRSRPSVGSPNATGLHNERGRLKGSLISKMLGRPTKLHGMKHRIQSRGVPYAFIQEFGGPINAKHAKWLTIPLDANRTPAGNRKKSLSQLIKTTKPANLKTLPLKSGEPGWVVVKFKNVRKGGKRDPNEKGTPMFLLKKSVRLKARLKFFATWEADEEQRFRRHVRALHLALDDAKKLSG